VTLLGVRLRLGGRDWLDFDLRLDVAEPSTRVLGEGVAGTRARLLDQHRQRPLSNRNEEGNDPCEDIELPPQVLDLLAEVGLALQGDDRLTLCRLRLEALSLCRARFA
jgi:hypothetical protein